MMLAWVQIRPTPDIDGMAPFAATPLRLALGVAAVLVLASAAPKARETQMTPMAARIRAPAVFRITWGDYPQQCACRRSREATETGRLALALKKPVERLMSWLFFRRLIGHKRCAALWRYLGANIAPDAHISTHTSMRKPENIRIGTGCKLAGPIMLDAWKPITFEPNVLVNGAQFRTAGHDTDSPYLLGVAEPIHVGEYAWIIGDVIVLPGVTIGKAAVVGTGSVVTKDVAEYAIVAGNPARFIRERKRVDFYYVPSGAWLPPGVSHEEMQEREAASSD
jgi:acetyltransferase-like isoleucine patch superfamily enzyme